MHFCYFCVDKNSTDTPIKMQQESLNYKIITKSVNFTFKFTPNCAYLFQFNHANCSNCVGGLRAFHILIVLQVGAISCWSF